MAGACNPAGCSSQVPGTSRMLACVATTASHVLQPLYPQPLNLSGNSGLAVRARQRTCMLSDPHLMAPRTPPSVQGL